MKLDNFALVAHQTCPAKYLLRIEQGWTVRRKGAPLGFGGALHAGLAEWYRGKGLAAAINAIHKEWPAEMPVDDYRTESKCVETMIAYARNYPTESWKVVGAPDNPMVEVSFSLDTGMFVSCYKCGATAGEPDPDGRCYNCGEPCEPIEYGGIFDGLADFANQLYVLEHKSTSRMGNYYFTQFKPNNQITGYIWAGEKLTGKRVAGALVNAMGVYKASATKFDRHITTRNEADIAEWLQSVKAGAEEIQQHKRTGVWPLRTSACTLYGLCEFHSVHVLSYPNEREKRLQNDYVMEPWDYERRDEEQPTVPE